jgi:hypothetical protein
MAFLFVHRRLDFLILDGDVGVGADDFNLIFRLGRCNPPWL